MALRGLPFRGLRTPIRRALGVGLIGFVESHIQSDKKVPGLINLGTFLSASPVCCSTLLPSRPFSYHCIVLIGSNRDCLGGPEDRWDGIGDGQRRGGMIPDLEAWDDTGAQDFPPVAIAF